MVKIDDTPKTATDTAPDTVQEDTVDLSNLSASTDFRTGFHATAVSGEFGNLTTDRLKPISEALDVTFDPAMDNVTYFPGTASRAMRLLTDSLSFSHPSLELGLQDHESLASPATSEDAALETDIQTLDTPATLVFTCNRDGQVSDISFNKTLTA